MVGISSVNFSPDLTCCDAIFVPPFDTNVTVKLSLPIFLNTKNKAIATATTKIKDIVILIVLLILFLLKYASFILPLKPKTVNYLQSILAYSKIFLIFLKFTIDKLLL